MIKSISPQHKNNLNRNRLYKIKYDTIIPKNKTHFNTKRISLRSNKSKSHMNDLDIQKANEWISYLAYYALNDCSNPPTDIIPPVIMKNITTNEKITKNQLEDNAFQDAVKIYQEIEKQEVLCFACQKLAKKINSFGCQNGYVCMNCAARLFSRINELQDWEEIIDFNAKGIQCDRLRHQKNLHSFIKFENKTGTYKRVKLCTFCRNVKRWEYSRKALYPSGNVSPQDKNEEKIEFIPSQYSPKVVIPQFPGTP